jgi:hypothetical protein
MKGENREYKISANKAVGDIWALREKQDKQWDGRKCRCLLNNAIYNPPIGSGVGETINHLHIQYLKKLKSEEEEIFQNPYQKLKICLKKLFYPEYCRAFNKLTLNYLKTASVV